MPPVIAVVIPVYNHREGLRDVVQRVLNQCGTIIVVDDGPLTAVLIAWRACPSRLCACPATAARARPCWLARLRPHGLAQRT